MRIAAIVNGVRPGSPGWDAPWVVKPQLGDLFDTSREEALRVLYEELAVLGRFHSIAVLMRGVHDPWTSVGTVRRYRELASRGCGWRVRLREPAALEPRVEQHHQPVVRHLWK